MPSSEADARAFSFDIIPSSQMDNLTIIKSPSAEYPADYTGGFIMVSTKEIPDTDGQSISLGANWNTASTFRRFEYGPTAAADFLGFGSPARSLPGGMNAALPALAGSRADNAIDLTRAGISNDWDVRHRRPLGDLKLAADISRRWHPGNTTIGMLAALNYTNETRTLRNMENNLFGIYDAANDRPNYLRRSTDNQYNANTRLGAMLNFTLLSADGNHKLQLRNIFNQLGTSRYTWREGVSAQSDTEHSAEYYYRSRSTFNTQLTGKHTLGAYTLDWNTSYAYANRHLPDRRRYLLNDIDQPGTIALHTGNDITREWTRLGEHIASAGVNGRRAFRMLGAEAQAQAGGYGEWRSRDYTTRSFCYEWNPSSCTLPDGFRTSDVTRLLGDEANFGTNGLYLIELRQMRNNYRGHNALGAAYATLTLPFGPVSVHAGLRFEHNDMTLISNTRDTERSERSRHYRTDDLFPSVNATWRINDRHQLRLSYGRSVNRPEFREVSPSVYYDFDLASDVQGNTELRSCHIDNADLRYEFYPSHGETISLAAFCKRFLDPIEWTYTVAGGTNLVYSYKNAESAVSYGLELDIRKSLDFIGLRGLSWSFNGALIKSSVRFPKGSREENRPMQGQSPYLINTGLFYHNDRHAFDLSLLYNRIGKRIIGVGRSEGSSASDDNARVPHSYEMPRNALDLSASKKWGEHWELKLSVRDILAERVCYKQFADVTRTDGTTRREEELARSYRPGRNIALTATWRF